MAGNKYDTDVVRAFAKRVAIDGADHEMDGGEALSKENNGIEATKAADGRLDVR